MGYAKKGYQKKIYPILIVLAIIQSILYIILYVVSWEIIVSLRPVELSYQWRLTYKFSFVISILIGLLQWVAISLFYKRKWWLGFFAALLMLLVFFKSMHVHPYRVPHLVTCFAISVVIAILISRLMIKLE